VGAFGQGPVDENAILGGFRIFDHHDGIGPTGQRGAGHDSGRRSLFQAEFTDLSGGNILEDLQGYRLLTGCAQKIHCLHGIPIHGRPVEGRDGKGTAEIFTQDSPKTFQHGYLFGF